MTHTETITITEAAKTLTQAAKFYFSKDDKGKYLLNRRRQRPLCLMGSAGIGKTEIVSQVAESLDLALCSYSIAHHTRQSLLGLPKLETMDIAGKTVSCTRYTMSEIIDEIHQTMNETGKKEGILFLDEFNCANESIRPVMLQLLQDKSFGTHPIPEGWMLVLAGNPPQYNKSAKTLDAVTLDRLRMLYVEADFEDWMPYAKEKNIHHIILSYLGQNPAYFSRYELTDKGTELVTPRAWEDMSLQLHMLESIGEAPTLSFLGEFIQCEACCRGFLLHYMQYDMFVGDGLLDGMLAGKETSLAKLQKLDLESRWSLIDNLVTHVENKATILKENGKIFEELSTRKSTTALKKSLSTAQALLLTLEKSTPDKTLRQTMQGWSTALSQGLDYASLAKEIDLAKETHKEKELQFIAEVENISLLCHEGLNDAPSIEKLLEGLCQHIPTTQLLSQHYTPAFRKLVDSLAPNPEDIFQDLAEDIQQAV